MDYIFKNQFLEFDQKNKNRNFQYYHWTEKKRVEKQKSEYEQFRKMWFQIEQDQKDQHKNKPKIQQHNDKKTSVKPEELYHKNLQWKQGVESKLQKKRQEKRQEKQRQFQLLKQSKYKEPKLLRDCQHKGPIKAWQQRFNSYLRSKGGEQLNECPQGDFHPKIDKNSRRITKQMIGKVEDRLIEYGEKLKEKKIEMETIYEEQLQAQRNMGNNQSIESQMSDVYWRLYKDGERINQKRNVQKSEFSFTPQINQYSIEIASRITEKRTPLYQSKVINSKVQQEKQKLIVKQKKGSEKGFNDFLKRNEALLTKIQKNRLKKLEVERQKQNKEIKECTFTPQLNPKSLKMFANFSTLNAQEQQKIQNISKIQMDVNEQIDQESLEKKLTIVKSEHDPINSYEKQARSTQRIQRLHSDGNFNILSQTSNLFIDDIDSISNLQENKKSIRITDSPSISINRNNSKYRSNQSDFLATDRQLEKAPIYNIYEEVQEDSIERQRDNDWEKELHLMEQQIQAMMGRTNY